jgi:hypothetical protein
MYTAKSSPRLRGDRIDSLPLRAAVRMINTIPLIVTPQ